MNLIKRRAFAHQVGAGALASLAMPLRGKEHDFSADVVFVG